MFSVFDNELPPPGSTDDPRYSGDASYLTDTIDCCNKYPTDTDRNELADKCLS